MLFKAMTLHIATKSESQQLGVSAIECHGCPTAECLFATLQHGLGVLLHSLLDSSSLKSPAWEVPMFYYIDIQAFDQLASDPFLSVR